MTRFDATYGHAECGSGFSSSDPAEMARYMLSQPHEGASFPAAACVVPFPSYAAEVIRLAESVLDFAGRAEKRFQDDFDRSEWIGWQVEIRDNLDNAAARLNAG